MIAFHPNRLIAVFDLDGCIFQAPATETITEPDYWSRHFRDIEGHKPNIEILYLLNTLTNSVNWQVVILTGRSEHYRVETETVLMRNGIYTVHPDRISKYATSPILVMYSGDLPTAEWKASTIEGWKESGARVAFVVEDYSKNVRAIRRHAPVLCYERVKDT